MSETDRVMANEYHEQNYLDILKALNNHDEAEARAICVREIKIINEDFAIEADEEDKKIIEFSTTTPKTL